MDALLNSLAGIPWYGWVVIVVMICTAIVAIVKAKSGKSSA